MKLFDFVWALIDFYPTGEAEDKKIRRVNAYVDILAEKISKSRDKYDFRKLLKHIQMNYTYKQLPSIPQILEYLPQGIVYEKSYSGKEGEIIKRELNGHVYEFTIVPNHWKGVKTLKELDADIYFRTRKVE